MKKFKLISRLISVVIVFTMLIGTLSPSSIVNASEAYVTSSMLSLNRFTTYVLKGDGTVMAAGNNAHGQLGINSTVSSRTFVNIPTLSKVKCLASGPESGAAASSCMYAIMNDGTVKGWGSNNYNQLGLGDTTNRLVPTTIPELANVSQIAIGGGHALALVNGEVWAWGYNNYGQCGDGLSVNVTVPKKVNGISNVTKVFAGTGTSYALLANGTVMAWGNNAGNGGIGLASQKISKVLPTLIPNLVNVRDMAIGYCTNFVILNDNTVKAWGMNSYYALGISDSAVPTVVKGLTSVKKISPGIMHTLVLFTNGTVKACGKNSQGEVGVGNQSIVSSFTAISGVTNVSDIQAGGDDSAAVLKDGTIKMWGQNYAGRFTLPNSNYLVPTIIPGITVPLPAVETPTISVTPTTPTNTPVTVNISYGNVATVKQYRIGLDGTWMNYTGPVEINSNCNVYAVGKDDSGNNSQEAVYTISNIDKVQPTTPTYTSNYSRLMFSAGTDGESGVKEVQYRIDSGAWMVYTDAVALTKGVHSFEAKSIDNAGNESSIVTGTVDVAINDALEIGKSIVTYNTVINTGYYSQVHLVETKDGGYIAGPSESSSSQNAIIKYSSDNKELWRIFTITGVSEAVELSDGSILIQGVTNDHIIPNMTGQEKARVFNNCIYSKYDASGKLMWSKRGEHEVGGHVTATSDGGFAAMENAFYPNARNAGTNRVLEFFKFDSNGIRTSNTRFKDRCDNSSYYRTIVATNDVVYVDYNDEFTTGKYHLAKLSTNGTVIWDKSDLSFVQMSLTTAKSVAANDDGVVIVGNELVDNKLAPFILKVDAGGNSVWKRHYIKTRSGFQNQGVSVCQTTGGYIILCTEAPQNTSTGNADVFILCYDEYGNLISEKRFEGTQTDRPWDVLCTNTTLLISANTLSRDGDFSFVPVNPVGHARVVIGLKGYGKSSSLSAPVITPDTTEMTAYPVTLTITYPPTAVIKQFSTDGVNYSDYASPVLITANNSLCTAKYQDASGSWSPVASYTVNNIIGEIKIDKPRIILSTTEPTNKSITVTIDFGNAAHGHYFTDDDNRPRPYTGPFIVYDNDHIYSMGSLGSLSSGNDLIVDNIDKWIPNPPSYSINEHKLVLTAGADSGSGVKEVQYQLDDGEWKTYTEPIAVTPGAHEIHAKTIDKAGNMSLTLIETVTVMEK